MSLNIFCILESLKATSIERIFTIMVKFSGISIAPSVASRSKVTELIFEKFSLGKILVAFIFHLGKNSIDSVGPFPIVQNT